MATIDDAANPVDQVAHHAHRRSRHQWPEDIDGDGDVDSTDVGLVFSISYPILIGTGTYNADADLDRDGDVDGADLSRVTGASPTAAIAPGAITDAGGSDNVIGYKGVVFSDVALQYTMRHRTYDPRLGRFLERDPAGYVDGMSLYEYVRSSPSVMMDPMGLYLWAHSQEIVRSPLARSSAETEFYHPGHMPRDLASIRLPRDDRWEWEARVEDMRQQRRLQRRAERYAQEYFESDLYQCDHRLRDIPISARRELLSRAIQQRFTDAEIGRLWRGFALEAAGTVVRTVAEPVDWVISGAELLDGNMAAAAGFIPFVPGAIVKTARAGGRLGSQATGAHVADVAAELERRGWRVTGGGGLRAEEYLPGPGGGHLGSNWVDITAVKNGRNLRINTIDTLADGLTPTAREAASAAAIRARTGEHLLLVPKPK